MYILSFFFFLDIEKRGAIDQNCEIITKELNEAAKWMTILRIYLNLQNTEIRQIRDKQLNSNKKKILENQQIFYPFLKVSINRVDPKVVCFNFLAWSIFALGILNQ